MAAFESGEGNAAVIMGMTIINGNSNPGGGVRCTDSSPTIVNNIITQNSALAGGGIYCYNANPFIANNVIINNGASGGGGIYCSSSDPMILNNIIIGNSTTGNGGGINCYSASPMISSNTFELNSASIGGAIYCHTSSDPAIVNNLIIRNVADYAGAIYAYSSSPIIKNNTICRNTATITGGAIYCNLADAIISNTILWADSAQSGAEIFVYNCAPIVSYCDIDGGWNGEGNIASDPLFRRSVNDEYHLKALECGWPQNSPCIDTGDPNILDILVHCLWGLGSSRSDIGAYGGGDSTIIGIDYSELTIPDQFLLSQNYPNPFNAQTTIQFSLPTQLLVTIDIFDILGRKIETIAEGKKPAGIHRTIWDANDQPSGIYFYRIKAGDYLEGRKMVLVR